MYAIRTDTPHLVPPGYTEPTLYAATIFLTIRRESFVIDQKPHRKGACLGRLTARTLRSSCYPADLEGTSAEERGLRGFMRLSKLANCGSERKGSNAGSKWRYKGQPERSS